MADDVDLGRGGLHQDTHDIDAPGSLRGAGPAEEFLGGGYQMPAFGSGDGFGGEAMRKRPTRFDLDEDEIVSLFGDEVDLPGMHPDVGGDDVIAGIMQSPGGDLLTPRAEQLLWREMVQSVLACHARYLF